MRPHILRKTTQTPRTLDRLSSLPPELLLRVLSNFESLIELRALLRACPACHYVYVANKRQILTQTITNTLIYKYWYYTGEWEWKCSTVIPKEVLSEEFVAEQVNAILNQGRSFGDVHYLELADRMDAILDILD